MSLSSVRSETALGRVPHLVAADSAFYSTKNKNGDTAKVMGVKGRISVVKRRHGLDRCRYKSDAGMQR